MERQLGFTLKEFNLNRFASSQYFKWAQHAATAVRVTVDDRESLDDHECWVDFELEISCPEFEGRESLRAGIYFHDIFQKHVEFFYAGRHVVRLRLKGKHVARGPVPVILIAESNNDAEGWRIGCLSVVGFVTPLDRRREEIRAIRSLAVEQISRSGDDPWQDYDQILDRLFELKKRNKPASVIRLGDGEGRLLGFPTLFSPNVLVPECLRYMFGRAALSEIYGDDPIDGFHRAVTALRGFLFEAIETADILGVPHPFHMKDQCDDHLTTAVLGFAQAYFVCRDRIDRIGCDNVFDTFIFKRAVRDRKFEEFVNGLEFLGFVSHQDITERFTKRYPDVSNTMYVEIPGHASFSELSTTHFPTELPNIVKKIEVPHEGAVFFVGGGYLGKLYCAEIKKKGGIAVDIGSVFDSWLGAGRTEAAADTSLRL